MARDVLAAVSNSRDDGEPLESAPDMDGRGAAAVATAAPMATMMSPAPAVTATKATKATPYLPNALAQWQKFLDRAERLRLDPEVFETYVPILASRHRLHPLLAADLLLRPSKRHYHVMDPRVPQYLQVLLKLRIVDSPTVLRVMYRYSTSQTYVPQIQAQPRAHGGGGKGRGKGRVAARHQQQQDQQQKEVRRWGNSYAYEELLFWGLARGLSQGIRSTREASEILRIVARWMVLFTDVAAVFSGDAFGAMHSLETKEEMEGSRQAFTLLLLGVCENAVVLDTLGRPSLKGRVLSLGLEAHRLVWNGC